MMRNSLQGHTERTESALGLIGRSEREDTIIVAPWSEVVEYDLHAICDGSVDAGQILEFWGGSHNEATHPGGWRVHLRRPPNDENL